jgi:EAL domain-containing protein (putative c-di-GMP-specific phosphodiesterase class I)
VPLGRWVLAEACRQVRAWEAEGVCGPDLALSVNLSARQFRHPSLVADVARALAETGLDPARLELELTESVTMEDDAATVAMLRALKGLGVRLAVDDFGTGCSAFSYFKRWPVDALKIDRSFVAGLGRDGEDETIVRAVVAFAQAMGLGVTAEGVETAAQLAALRELGCDRGQGFYFARPQPPQGARALLAASARLGEADERLEPSAAD